MVSDSVLSRRKNLAKAATDPLEPWHERYAEWFVVQPTSPSKAERKLTAEKMAGRHLPERYVGVLEKRDDYRAYVQSLLDGVIAEARATLMGQTQVVVDGHLKMFKLAVASNDYDKAAKYSGPIIEKIWPRREEAHEATAEIHIHLGSTGFAARAVKQIAADDADYEVVVTTPEPTE